MNKNTPVIGIDLSLTSTGVALPKETLVISTKTKDVARLIILRNEIINTVAEAVENPLVVIEGYSFAARNSHSHSLGELGGVVKVAISEKGWPWALVPPTVRAKFATGRGNASKSEVVSAVSARTGITWSGPGADDKCDAWILQEMGLTYLGRGRKDWPKTHLVALDSVEWPELK